MTTLKIKLKQGYDSKKQIKALLSEIAYAVEEVEVEDENRK